MDILEEEFYGQWLAGRQSGTVEVDRNVGDGGHVLPL